MKKKRIVSLMLTLVLTIGVSSQIPTVAFASTTNTIANTSRRAGVKALCDVKFRDNGIRYTITNPSSDSITVDYTIVAYDSRGNVLNTYSKSIELDGNDDIFYTRNCPGTVEVHATIVTTDNNGNETTNNYKFYK